MDRMDGMQALLLMLLEQSLRATPQIDHVNG